MSTGAYPEIAQELRSSCECLHFSVRSEIIKSLTQIVGAGNDLIAGYNHRPDGNLVLFKRMLRFGLPIYISGGNVKNIKIRRPNWTRLLLDPFEIEISGLHVEIQPTGNRTKEISSKDDLKFRRIQSLVSR